MINVDKDLLEDAQILRERPDIRSMILDASTLGKVEIDAVIIFAEALRLGASDTEAAREAALYLAEHGREDLASKIMADYRCELV